MRQRPQRPGGGHRGDPSGAGRPETVLADNGYANGAEVAALEANRPRRPVAPECFSRSRYLLQPLRLLPAGATVAGRGSHPQGDDAFPRRTE